MSSTSPQPQTYDFASLEARIQSLESIQHTLKSKLSDLRRQRESRLQTTASLSLKDAISGASDEEILSQAFTETKCLRDLQLENLYRMVGITTFAVKDPNPVYQRESQHSSREGKLIGIRIESFSAGKFLAPYYLLLAPHILDSNIPDDDQTRMQITSLSVRHHTIPSFLNLPSLIAQYLSPKVPIENQNLQKLVEELRRRITLYHSRLDMLDSARKIFLENREHDIDVDESFASSEEDDDEDRRSSVSRMKLGKLMSIASDNAAQLVKVEWNKRSKAIVAYLMLDEEGGVKKAVMKEYLHAEGEVRRKNKKGKYKNVETGFLENGVIEGIVLASTGT